MIQLISEHKSVEDDCYWEFKPNYYLTIEQDFIRCKGDNSRNSTFNQKLYKLINKEKALILDIGCGHGESVEDFINDGHTGIGLDGYPLFQKYSQPWIKFPNNFFICDIGKPFTFTENENTIIFDAITSWECFEHITTEDIDAVIENIHKHSAKGTLLICSIGNYEEKVHRTVKERTWWLEKFNKINFKEKDLGFGNDVVRNLFNTSHYFFMIKQ